MKNKNKIASKAKTLLTNAAALACSISMLTVSAAAAPAGVDTSTMDTLVTLIFWAVRLIILAVGGIPSLVKIVQGQADKNPRDRNAGIAGVAITGIIFAGSFALATLFK